MVADMVRTFALSGENSVGGVGGKGDKSKSGVARGNRCVDPFIRRNHFGLPLGVNYLSHTPTL